MDENQVGGFSAAYGPDKPEESLDMTKFRAKEHLSVRGNQSAEGDT